MAGTVEGPPVTPWKPNYLASGGVGPLDGPGWYATRTEQIEPTVMQASFHGPFKTEAECQAWIDEDNALAAQIATFATDEPVSAEARP
jgi:hypothetical protein